MFVFVHCCSSFKYGRIIFCAVSMLQCDVVVVMSSEYVSRFMFVGGSGMSDMYMWKSVHLLEELLF